MLCFYLFFSLFLRVCLGLTSVEDFFYTSQSIIHDNSRRMNRQSRNSISYNSENIGLFQGVTSGGTSDSLQFQTMRRAMDMLDFSMEKQDGIMDVLGIVLHLGNIDIEEKVSSMFDCLEINDCLMFRTINYRTTMRTRVSYETTVIHRIVAASWASTNQTCMR